MPRSTDWTPQDLIHISEAKMGRKLVDWYLRNLSRTYA